MKSYCEVNQISKKKAIEFSSDTTKKLIRICKSWKLQLTVHSKDLGNDVAKTCLEGIDEGKCKDKIRMIPSFNLDSQRGKDSNVLLFTYKKRSLFKKLSWTKSFTKLVFTKKKVFKVNSLFASRRTRRECK